MSQDIGNMVTVRWSGVSSEAGHHRGHGGANLAGAAHRYGLSPGWVSRLLARYRTEGEAAFEPRSRRPKTSPTAVRGDVVALVLAERDRLARAGHDAGPETISTHLARRQVKVSRPPSPGS